MRCLIPFAAALAVAGCSGCSAPDAEPVAEVPEYASAAYCSNACDYAGRAKCAATVNVCDNDPKNVVWFDSYVLSCRDGISASCGGPFGQEQCSAGCRGER